MCVLIATDNLLRWLERGGNSYWFCLCSGTVAMVVLFGILALVAQFFYWADIVKGDCAECCRPIVEGYRSCGGAAQLGNNSYY